MDSDRILKPDNPYLQSTIDKINSYQEGLWNNLEQVPQLEPYIGQKILSDFLEQACQSQHIGNIEIGRYGIFTLPRQWVLKHIGELAEPILHSEDSWEYRRLIEVYWHLDKELVQKLAKRGVKSQNLDIQEAGKECLEKLANPETNQIGNYWDI